MGMKMRYQMNFQVKPTDVYYPNLWQPAANSTLVTDSGVDGVYLPASWSDISFRASKSVFNDIAYVMTELQGTVILIQFVMPVFSILVMSYAGVVLYIRIRIEFSGKFILNKVKRSIAANFVRFAALC